MDEETQDTQNTQTVDPNYYPEESAKVGNPEESGDLQDEQTADFTEYLTSQDDLDDNPIQGNQKKQPQGEPEQKSVDEKTDKKPDTTENKTEPNPFDFVSTNEKGESVFDSKGAYDFMTSKAEQEFKPEPKIEKPAEAGGEKPLDNEAPSYEETLTNNLTSALKLFKEYREMGYDEASAMRQTERDITSDIKAHVQEKSLNERFAKFDEKEKALEEKTKTFELKPKSDSNLVNAVRRGNWGSSDRLEKALFDKELGGGFLAKQFQRENPDKTFKSTGEYVKALQDWFVRYSSDEESLMMAEEYAKAKIFMRNFPKLIEQARNKKAAVDKDRKETRVKGSTNKKTNSSPGGVSDKALSWMDVNV